MRYAQNPLPTPLTLDRLPASRKCSYFSHGRWMARRTMPALSLCRSQPRVCNCACVRMLSRGEI